MAIEYFIVIFVIRFMTIRMGNKLNKIILAFGVLLQMQIDGSSKKQAYTYSINVDPEILDGLNDEIEPELLPKIAEIINELIVGSEDVYDNKNLISIIKTRLFEKSKSKEMNTKLFEQFLVFPSFAKQVSSIANKNRKTTDFNPDTNVVVQWVKQQLQPSTQLVERQNDEKLKNEYLITEKQLKKYLDKGKSGKYYAINYHDVVRSKHNLNNSDVSRKEDALENQEPTSEILTTNSNDIINRIRQDLNLPTDTQTVDLAAKTLTLEEAKALLKDDEKALAEPILKFKVLRAW